MTDQPDTFKEMIEGPGVEPNPEWKNIKEENWKAWEEINNKKNGEEELKKSKANMRLVQEIHKEKVKHRESKKTIKFYIEKNERLLDKIKLEKRRREWWQEEYRKQEERMSDILDDNKSFIKEIETLTTNNSDLTQSIKKQEENINTLLFRMTDEERKKDVKLMQLEDTPKTPPKNLQQVIDEHWAKKRKEGQKKMWVNPKCKRVLFPETKDEEFPDDEGSPIY